MLRISVSCVLVFKLVLCCWLMISLLISLEVHDLVYVYRWGSPTCERPGLQYAEERFQQGNSVLVLFTLQSLPGFTLANSFYSQGYLVLPRIWLDLIWWFPYFSCEQFHHTREIIPHMVPNLMQTPWFYCKISLVPLFELTLVTDMHSISTLKWYNSYKNVMHLIEYFCCYLTCLCLRCLKLNTLKILPWHLIFMI